MHNKVTPGDGGASGEGGKKASKNRKRRGRGEGGVRWREGKQLWEGTVSLGYDGEGRRLRRTVYGASKREVLDEMARLRGQPSVPAEAARLTVAALVARWLDSTKARTAARTHEDRSAVCAAHLTPRLGPALVAKLTALQVEAFYASMRNDGVGPGAARHAARALCAALNYAARLGVVAASPAAAVDLPPEPQREMVVLSPELLRHFLARTARLPVHPLLCLALGTGMRRGELLGLHWPDVDLGGDAPSVTVRQALTWTKAAGFALKTPKTKAARRTVTLPPFAAEALRVLRVGRQRDGLIRAPVFCTRKGGFLIFRNVGNAFAAAVDWADDPEKGTHEKRRKAARPEPVIPEGFRFHDMRHTHASLLLSAGQSLKAVSARLGHANAALTLRTYAHAMPGDDARLAAAMEVVMTG